MRERVREVGKLDEEFPFIASRSGESIIAIVLNKDIPAEFEEILESDLNPIWQFYNADTVRWIAGW